MAAKLTAQAVKDLLNACSVPGDLHKQPFQGIITFYMLSPDAVKAHHQDIKELLLELPEQFLLSKGGGWSFLQAAFDKQGHHWGEHPDMEALITLGIAAGLVNFLLPREMWTMMPGGMPYLFVKDTYENSQ